MDSNIEDKFVRLLYFFAFVALVLVVCFNIQNVWPPAFLSGLLIFSLTMQHVLLCPQKRFSWSGKLLVLFDIVLIFFISLYDKSGYAGMYYFVIIADASYHFSSNFSYGITGICILSFLSGRYIGETNPFQAGAMQYAILHIVTLIFFNMIMNIIKHEVMQRQTLHNAMHELKIKSKRLEDAYIKLQDTAIDIEEMAVYSERNKIAREIHDTVGHTLTTALIEIEAGERLLEKNPELSAEKIRLAKSQVRHGLRDIRESVGMLNSGREMMDFASSVKLLMDEAAKHGEIYFRYEISEMPKLRRQQEKALYRALQEGITNGIKHGGSTAFVFRLLYEDGSVRFFLEDNGKGCDRIVTGFGLAAMEQRVREAGGILNVSSAINEGFRISISVPVREDDKSDEDKDNDSGRPTVDAGRIENNIGD